MAMTSAERQQAYRDREKAKRREKADVSGSYITGSFAEFFHLDTVDGNDEGDWDGVEEVFSLAGVTLPDFTVDKWPEFYSCDLEAAGLTNTGALGRAEMLAGALQEGLRILTEKINRFKQAEIVARMEKLAQSGSADPEEMKRHLKDAVELHRIAEGLKKSVRLTFPAYEIRG